MSDLPVTVDILLGIANAKADEDWLRPKVGRGRNHGLVLADVRISVYGPTKPGGSNQLTIALSKECCKRFDWPIGTKLAVRLQTGFVSGGDWLLLRKDDNGYKLSRGGLKAQGYKNCDLKISMNNDTTEAIGKHAGKTFTAVKLEDGTLAACLGG
jgi:hypothetical protein